MFWLLKLLNQVKYHKALYRLISSEAQVSFEFWQSLTKQALFCLLPGRDFGPNFFISFTIEVFRLINSRGILLKGFNSIVIGEFLPIVGMLLTDPTLNEVGVNSFGTKHMLLYSLNELLAHLKSKPFSVLDKLFTWSFLLLIA